jgi:hypothetical protein
LFRWKDDSIIRGKLCRRPCKVNWNPRNSKVATRHFLTALTRRSSHRLLARPGKVNQSQGLLFSTTVLKALANRPPAGGWIHLLVAIP